AEQALVNLGLPINTEELTRLDEQTMAKRIQFLGLPDSVVKSLDAAKTTANLLPVVAPMDGVVAERQVVPGEVVDSSKPMFVVADLSRVWIMIDVRLEAGDSLALN